MLEIIIINTAKTKDIIGKIKGIGPKKAQAIISYRKKNGPFTSIEHLVAVKGLGPAFISRHRSVLKDIFYCG